MIHRAPRHQSAARHLAASLLLLLALLPSLATAARDPLAPVLDLPAPPVATAPGDLFAPEQVDTITSFVNEAREFGVPLAVRAVTVPVSPQALSDAILLGKATPSAQAIVQRLADAWLAQEPIETSPDAADGILLLVVVPENQPTQTMAAFATGRNALPLNGLTSRSLNDRLASVMAPRFAEGDIAGGLASGISLVSYDNLFAAPARRERTRQQDALSTVTNTALFGLTIAASIALAAFAATLHRRQRAFAASPDPEASACEIGALQRGRADTAVTTAALMHLIRSGHLTLRQDVLHLAQPESSSIADPFLAEIHGRLAAAADPDGDLRDAAMRRLQDILAPARQRLENHLAAQGLFNPRAKVETVWLLLASALVAAIALLTLLPAILGMSRLGILGILIAGITIASVLTWTVRRSWTTPAGREAVTAWYAREQSEVNYRIIEEITHQEILLEAPGGPSVPPVVRLVRELRGLGAG